MDFNAVDGELYLNEDVDAMFVSDMLLHDSVTGRLPEAADVKNDGMYGLSALIAMVAFLSCPWVSFYPERR